MRFVFFFFMTVKIWLERDGDKQERSSYECLCFTYALENCYIPHFLRWSLPRELPSQESRLEKENMDWLFCRLQMRGEKKQPTNKPKQKKK